MPIFHHHLGFVSFETGRTVDRQMHCVDDFGNAIPYNGAMFGAWAHHIAND